MNSWAESKNLPGQFTGSTGAQLLSQSELAGTGQQAWLRKVGKGGTRTSRLPWGLGGTVLVLCYHNYYTMLENSERGSIDLTATREIMASSL